ncbi:MAG: hypothetical protein WC628_03435 [Candidatus Omnitrophota bacterium]
MARKTGFILGIAFSFLILNSGSVLSQDDPTLQPEKLAEIQAANDQPEVQWVWGEVSALDTQNKAITLKYLDYETDQEKEIAISIDDKTGFENIKAFEEIKPGDSLSVDYIAAADGKYIAKNISLEQLDLPPLPEAIANATAEIPTTANDTAQ